MTKNSGNYKRHYPKFGPCCFCCSKRTSALASTSILLILEIIGIVYDITFSPKDTIVDYNTIVKVLSYISFGFSIAITISYSLILIGFSNVFIGHSIYRIIIIYDNKYVEYYMKTALKMQKESLIKFELNEFTFMTENEIRRSFETGRVNGIFIAVVAYALFIIYYLATCSYIEDLEEEAFEEKQTRKLENY